MSTIIRPCTCESSFQDRIYGKKRRIFNYAPSKGAKLKRYRCTVCATEKDF